MNKKTSTNRFCETIRSRSKENRIALSCFQKYDNVISPAFSILRQELDSMIRVIYLLTIKDVSLRENLIDKTLNGGKWIIIEKGKKRKIKDCDMVDVANKLQGWSKSVYKFGCGFIHLSYLHDHNAKNPFDSLSSSDKSDILTHMRYYHHGPKSDNPSMQELCLYIPRIFNKIAENLDCYLRQLENNETKEI
jgi:hypothetical protein